jgi:hypothetical protein
MAAMAPAPKVRRQVEQQSGAVPRALRVFIDRNNLDEVNEAAGDNEGEDVQDGGGLVLNGDGDGVPQDDEAEDGQSGDDTHSGAASNDGRAAHCGANADVGSASPAKRKSRSTTDGCRPAASRGIETLPTEL